MKVGKLRTLLEGVDDDLEVTMRGGEVEFRTRVKPKGRTGVRCDTCGARDYAGRFSAGQVAGHAVNGAQCPGTWRKFPPTPAAGGEDGG